MRNLRQIVFVAVLTSMLYQSGSAQHQVNGLYKTEADFGNRLLTDSQPTDDNNCIYAYRTKLNVVRDGQIVRYRIDDVFGYYQDGVTYRAYRKKAFAQRSGFYAVVRNGALMIYSKRATHHRSNGYSWLYYSIGQAGQIKPLTKRNLSHDFAAQHEFLDAALLKLASRDPKEHIAIAELYPLRQ
jgi:hypothetical protein